MQNNNSNLIVAAMIGCAILFAGELFKGSAIVPAPAPRPAEGPDYVAAFATNDDRAEARRHAHDFETILEALADGIEYDQSKKERRFSTGVQIDDFRIALREYRMGGWSFMSKYPGVAAETEKWMESQVGTGGGPLTDEDVKSWIKATRTAAACAKYAAEH